MKRSTIWLIVLLALAILVSPLTSTMQQAGRIPTIGELGSNAPTPEAIGGESPFWQAMRQLGWVEGQNIAVEQRYTKGHDERLPAFAAELVQRPVDVLLVSGTPAVLAAKHATSTIPIVMWSAGDPVSLGLIESLGRPGGNITGVSLLATELAGKTLGLLREALPGVTHVVVLTSGNPIEVHLMSAMAEAAQRLGLTLQPVEARSPDDFDVAFATIIQGRAEALYVMSNGLNLSYRRRIIGFAVKHNLPVISDRTIVTHAGGLMSYQHDWSEVGRHIAVVVDKILKGAKPADLPVEQPMRFQLAINLKTAKILGLAMPPPLLFQADEVIQAAAAGTIPRPPEVHIMPPAAHLPPEVAAFSGTWEGAWSGGLPSRLVVEEIDMASARVVYAWADHPQRPFPGGWVRVRAKVLPGGTLRWSSDVTFTFTMTKDRLSIEGELGEAEQRSTVIMKKVERE